MRKGLLFIELMLLPMVVNAQVAFDKTSVDGETRTVMSKGANLYTMMVAAAGFRLETTNVMAEEGLYELMISINESAYQIEKGRKLLIKFSDGSIMELENITKIGPEDYVMRKSPSVGYNYIVNPHYLITEVQINEIISKNAVKVRIEYDAGQLDREIKKNKLGKGLSKMLPEIKKALSEQKTIYDNF